jgi:hypothetical protein
VWRFRTYVLKYQSLKDSQYETNFVIQTRGGSRISSGGGGGALKKIAPSGGRREHFWGISCEKSRFYANKSYFFRLRRETGKFLRYFV